MKRPMLYWVSLFILGEVVSRILPIGMLGIIISGMVCIPIMIYGFTQVRRIGDKTVWPRVRNRVVKLHEWKEYRKILLIGILFFLFGAVCMTSTQNKILYCQEKEGEEVLFVGTVVELEPSEKGDYYIIQVKELDHKRQHINIRIDLEEKQRLVLGSRVIGTGIGKPFSRATNPGGYDDQDYRYGKGVFLFLKKTVIRENTEPVIPVRESLYRLRLHLSKVYDTLFTMQDASIAKAMVLGDKKSLDTDIKQLYQRNGIAHLIAISGLHIAMIGGLFYQLVRKSFGSYPVAAVIGITFIVCYGIMTGLSGSAFRAIVMLVVSIGADLYGRKYDMLTAIAAALLIMLVNNPYQITQVSFLLSFGAVLGIAVVEPVWKQILKKVPKCLDGLMVSLSVQMVLLPVLLYYFYEVPVYGIFLNIIVVPLMSLLLFFLITCGILGSFLLNGGVLLARFAEIIFWFYEKVCNISEELPFHTFCTGRPSFIWMMMYYGSLLLFLLAGYRKKGGVLRLSVLMMIGEFLFFLLPGPFRICVFDVGQGDGIFIQTPYRTNILMDGGSISKQNVGTYILKNGIRYYGGDVLDYVFISHCDSDHYSGIAELLEDDSMKIKNMVLPAIANPDKVYDDLADRAREKGCHVYFIKKGDSLEIDGVRFQCLNPEQRTYMDRNQGSIVMLVTYRKFDLLLTGDIDGTIEENVMKYMAKQKDTTLELLKVPHHGSKTASSEDFLRKLSPSVSCVSVGENNRYGHPAPEVLSRLEQYCDKVYLTKDSGAITIETDGTGYRIHPFLKR